MELVWSLLLLGSLTSFTEATFSERPLARIAILDALHDCGTSMTALPCNNLCGKIGNTGATFAEQPLARIAVQDTLQLFDSSVSITASPDLLGVQGEGAEYVTVQFKRPLGAEDTDWIGVFSPATFNGSLCSEPAGAPNSDQEPLLCSAPVKLLRLYTYRTRTCPIRVGMKEDVLQEDVLQEDAKIDYYCHEYSYANFSTPDYASTGEGMLNFRLINMRADYSFGFFMGDVTNPVLLAISNTVKFSNPKAPGYLRLASGQQWNEITVTWTSGYGADEAVALVKWGIKDETDRVTTVAGTLTFTRNDMYFYQVGHKLNNGSYDWGRESFFKAPPYPGQDSLQRVVIFGDMGKAERDGSNEFSNYQLASLNTTDRLAEDLDNYDFILHNGDLAYANGYISQWDQFIEQIEVLSSRVPYMTTSGNHERDWPFSGSYYHNSDSGGECGVPSQSIFNMPAKNRANYWYATDWGMFHFCIANTELDWREGTEQYKFLEECFASVDRQKQPWLIFVSHRVLGYSSGDFYALEGTFNEPGGRDDLQKLWQKYKVDLAFYGHVHNYERTCPVYQSICVSQEREHYSGKFNATIHVVAGGGGAGLTVFTTLNTSWSYVKDDNYGFTKLTAFNHSSLLVEYKRSDDGQVYDKFGFTRNYKDVLGCDRMNLYCPPTSLAS